MVIYNKEQLGWQTFYYIARHWCLYKSIPWFSHINTPVLFCSLYFCHIIGRKIRTSMFPWVSTSVIRTCCTDLKKKNKPQCLLKSLHCLLYLAWVWIMVCNHYIIRNPSPLSSLYIMVIECKLFFTDILYFQCIWTCSAVLFCPVAVGTQEAFTRSAFVLLCHRLWCASLSSSEASFFSIPSHFSWWDELKTVLSQVLKQRFGKSFLLG